MLVLWMPLEIWEDSLVLYHLEGAGCRLRWICTGDFQTDFLVEGNMESYFLPHNHIMRNGRILLVLYTKA